MAYDNTNRGAMWPNNDKASEKHPDFKGSLNADGIEYWVSGWKRKANANPAAPAIAFTIESKQKDRVLHREDKREPPTPVDYSFDDDLPF